jgi:hypothetical protein
MVRHAQSRLGCLCLYRSRISSNLHASCRRQAYFPASGRSFERPHSLPRLQLLAHLCQLGHTRRALPRTYLRPPANHRRFSSRTGRARRRRPRHDGQGNPAPRRGAVRPPRTGARLISCQKSMPTREQRVLLRDTKSIKALWQADSGGNPYPPRCPASAPAVVVAALNKPAPSADLKDLPILRDLRAQPARGPLHAHRHARSQGARRPLRHRSRNSTNGNRFAPSPI